MKKRLITPARNKTLGVGVLLLAGVVLSANAATLTYNLDLIYSGTAPEGPTPWATAVFDDSVGGANTVRLTMSATNLVGTEYISQWDFNFDPTKDASILSFAAVDNAAAPAQTIQAGNNAFTADGLDGFYDIEFAFENANNPDRFTAGETVIYDITYDSPINVLDFRYFSDPRPGGNRTDFSGTVAHILSIGSGGSSGWIVDTLPGGGAPVPIPAAVWLFGSGLLGLIGVARRKAD